MAGTFILSIAVFGLFFTFFMLTPMLMAIGPMGEQRAHADPSHTFIEA